MSDELKEKAVVNEAMTIAPACPNGQLYTVKPGDTLFQIARSFNVSLQNLICANPQIANPNVIYPGQIICVPVEGVEPRPRPMPRPMPIIPRAQCPDSQIYQVVAGDTMYDIANRYGISLADLIEANPQIEDPNVIFPGQEICIPWQGRAYPCDGVLYTVVSGDTLFDIALRNNMSLSTLIAANPQITDPDRIYPGQVICLPTTGIQPEPPEMPEPPLMPPVAPPTPCPPPVMPIPVAPMPRPMPIQRPCPGEMPPHPMPIKRPCPPGPGEMPAPYRPMPPYPMPIQRPCPPGPGEMPAPYQPMPVYVVVPWDECPYRPKKRKKKHDRKHHRCCR